MLVSRNLSYFHPYRTFFDSIYSVFNQLSCLIHDIWDAILIMASSSITGHGGCTEDWCEALPRVLSQVG